MKEITPITIWQNGQLKSATHLGLTLVHDNLQDIAVFSYRLCNIAQSEDGAVISELSTGAVSIEGEQYTSWGVNVPANDEAYTIISHKLNLSLIQN